MQKMRFDELQLSQETERAVADMGFEELTPIQAQAIPLVIEGRDVVGQAQTGTGKTLAFGIPIVELLGRNSRSLEALIICPTRELAIQVSGELKKLARHRKDLSVVTVYGGQPIQRQITDLKKAARIVVGTPGRILDHMNRGTLRLGMVRIVVLDEADEMLDMGFLDDVETILGATAPERQTLLFSATIPRTILALARKYQKDSQMVNVVSSQLTVPEVEQTYFEVSQGTKIDVLCRLIDTYNLNSSLVFCNTKRQVDKVARDLQTRGYRADSLHGDMNQSRRERTMLKFRKNLSKILVATDVAARGLDVEGIEAVINYDLPRDEQYYVHRIGRTARMGKGGRAITLILSYEIGQLLAIQRYAKTKITRQPTPTQKATPMVQGQAVDANRKRGILCL
jgi:ATP-dependent RNA helicase DeaD